MAFECFTSGHLSRVAICICFKCDCVFNLPCNLLMIIARAMRVEIQVMQEPIYRLTRLGATIRSRSATVSSRPNADFCHLGFMT
jgi:hypothetical protein